MPRRTTIIERCPYIPGTDIGVYQRKEHEEIGFFLGQVRHELLEYAEEGGSLDLRQAEGAFRQFRGELEEHIHSEESQVFPSWAQSHPGDRRLIDLFLRQHQDIRVLVARVDAWLKNPGPESSRTNRARGLHLVDTLRDALQGHEQGEERLWPVKARAGVERMAASKSSRAQRKRQPTGQERRERDALRAELARGNPSKSIRALTDSEKAARRGEVWSDYNHRYVPVSEYFTPDQAAAYYQGMGLDRDGRVVSPPVPDVPWDGPKPLGSRFERLRAPLQAHTPAGRKAIYNAVLALIQQRAIEQNRGVAAFRLYQRDIIEVDYPRSYGFTGSSLELTFGPKQISIRPETVSILTEHVPLKGAADRVAEEVKGWVDHFLRKTPGWSHRLPENIEAARQVSHMQDYTPLAGYHRPPIETLPAKRGKKPDPRALRDAAGTAWQDDDRVARRLSQDWANSFAARDALRGDPPLPLPEQMREVAWELGYEHAQNGLDPYERVLGRFEALAESYGVDLHAEFSRGFQENGGVEARVSRMRVLSTKGTHLASGSPRR